MLQMEMWSKLLVAANKELDKLHRYCKAKQMGNLLREVHFPRHRKRLSLTRKGSLLLKGFRLYRVFT